MNNHKIYVFILFIQNNDIEIVWNLTKIVPLFKAWHLWSKQSVCLFLNQVYASLSTAYDWFLKIAFVHDIGMYMCVSLPPGLLIISSVMWYDINLIGVVGYSWYWYSRCALRLLITCSMMWIHMIGWTSSTVYIHIW